ncbi:hypothetical protein GGI07_005219 [Coemansia sp. Benny D115]|nr:hypothetical protein GGI07_005219 [Coemansia sp. Benny D115]
MSSYRNKSASARPSAYEDATDGGERFRSSVEPKSYNANEVHVQSIPSPSIDITNMGGDHHGRPTAQYMPYAGAYSESAWPLGRSGGGGGDRMPANRDSMMTARGNGAMDDVPIIARSGGGGGYRNSLSDPTAKPETTYSDVQSGIVGFKEMGRWNATRFVFYVLTRLAQLVVAIVCIAFLADSRTKRAYDDVDGTERNTEIAVFVVGGITAVTAAVSIALHFFARTRKRIEKSRLAWFTVALNFAIFVTWIILILINVIVVDCSKKTDGTWCRNIKVSSATGLISAILALVIVLRSFSVLIRAGRVKMWATP